MPTTTAIDSTTAIASTTAIEIITAVSAVVNDMPSLLDGNGVYTPVYHTRNYEGGMVAYLTLGSSPYAMSVYRNTAERYLELWDKIQRFADEGMVFSATNAEGEVIAKMVSVDVNKQGEIVSRQYIVGFGSEGLTQNQAKMLLAYKPVIQALKDGTLEQREFSVSKYVSVNGKTYYTIGYASRENKMMVFTAKEMEMILGKMPFLKEIAPMLGESNIEFRPTPGVKVVPFTAEDDSVQNSVQFIASPKAGTPGVARRQWTGKAYRIAPVNFGSIKVAALIQAEEEIKNLMQGVNSEEQPF